MKYGWVVHSFTDFAKSGSCGCAGSNVSVTICCAGRDATANNSAAPTRNFLMPDLLGSEQLKGEMISLSFGRGAKGAGVLRVLRVLRVLKVLVLWCLVLGALVLGALVLQRTTRSWTDLS